ncbi:MAG TPA: ABC transporter substrate-binding protein [Acetobacteraceae bacterium]|nr:ABC transporter substrate-binding protein [Acetobacteraceae bacterium]
MRARADGGGAVTGIGRRAALGALLGLTGLAATPARSATIVEVAEPIVAFNDTLVAIMKAGKVTPFPQRYHMLAPVLERTFDLNTILQACIGPRWSALMADDQTTLETAFTAFTIATWVANFDEYNGQRFEVSPSLRAVGNDQIVEVVIQRMSGDSKKIDYVMRQEGSWRVVDVLLDGTISRVAVQRSDFRSLISGDNVSALIASLRRKVSDLSGGTMHT